MSHPLLRCLPAIALSVALIGTSTATRAQDDAPFTDGHVFKLSTIRTGANSQDEYLKQLSQFWYPTMAKAKEMGLIVDFHILTGMASNKEDYDIMLIIEVKSLADMDPNPDREAKWKQLREATKTAAGGQEKLDAVRATMDGKREILGQKIMREQLHK